MHSLSLSGEGDLSPMVCVQKANSVQTEIASENQKRSIYLVLIYILRVTCCVSHEISHQEEFLLAALGKPISFLGTAVYFFMWELVKSQDFMVAFVFLFTLFSP